MGTKCAVENDLDSHELTLTEAINFAENQQTALEAVGEWRYALNEMLAEDNDDQSPIGNIFDRIHVPQRLWI